jgi:cytochrome P450
MRQELKTLNPLRPYLLWKYNRTLKRILVPYIQNEFKRQVEQDGFRKIEADGPKTILGLAIAGYLKEAPDAAKTGTIDPSFIDDVVAQIKIFLFAGHDTSGATLCFIYYLLARNPSALAKVREELDSVLGPDVRTCAANISRNPNLLNQLPYTSAVIKETLRMYPPAATMREGQKDFFLTHPTTGQRFPTEGFAVLGAAYASMRNPRSWPRPNEFLPERFLARDETDPLYVKKNHWRPFEQGPRNCIGQEFAQIEMRMMIALTVREFDIVPAYPTDTTKLLGEPCYQVKNLRDVTAHPRDRLPVVVTRRAEL